MTTTDTARTALEPHVRDFLAESFRLDPLEATNAGVHDHDARWPDWSSAGIAERLAFVDRWAARLEAIPAADLSPTDAIDRDRLLLELGDRKYEARFADDAWNPMTWVYRLGDGTFTLPSPEFAPPAERLASFAGRLEGLPAVVASAKQRLASGDAGVPVSRFHTDIAILNLAGIDDLIDEGLALAAARGADAGVAGLGARLEAAAGIAKEA